MTTGPGSVPVNDHDYDEGWEAFGRGDWTPGEVAAASPSFQAGFKAAAEHHGDQPQPSNTVNQPREHPETCPLCGGKVRFGRCRDNGCDFGAGQRGFYSPEDQQTADQEARREHGFTALPLQQRQRLLGYQFVMPDGRLDHTTCLPGAHDRSLPERSRPYNEPFDDDGLLSDAQARAADGLLGCNDCGRPLFYCLNDEQYHHVDPGDECFLAGAWGA